MCKKLAVRCIATLLAAVLLLLSPGIESYQAAAADFSAAAPAPVSLRFLQLRNLGLAAKRARAFLTGKKYSRTVAQPVVPNIRDGERQIVATHAIDLGFTESVQAGVSHQPSVKTDAGLAASHGSVVSGLSALAVDMLVSGSPDAALNKRFDHQEPHALPVAGKLSAVKAFLLRPFSGRAKGAGAEKVSDVPPSLTSADKKIYDAYYRAEISNNVKFAFMRPLFTLVTKTMGALRGMETASKARSSYAGGIAVFAPLSCLLVNWLPMRLVLAAGMAARACIWGITIPALLWLNGPGRVFVTWLPVLMVLDALAITVVDPANLDVNGLEILAKQYNLHIDDDIRTYYTAKYEHFGAISKFIAPLSVAILSIVMGSILHTVGIGIAVSAAWALVGAMALAFLVPSAWSIYWYLRLPRKIVSKLNALIEHRSDDGGYLLRDVQIYRNLRQASTSQHKYFVPVLLAILGIHLRLLNNSTVGRIYTATYIKLRDIGDPFIKVIGTRQLGGRIVFDAIERTTLDGLLYCQLPVFSVHFVSLLHKGDEWSPLFNTILVSLSQVGSVLAAKWMMRYKTRAKAQPVDQPKYVSFHQFFIFMFLAGLATSLLPIANHLLNFGWLWPGFALAILSVVLFQRYFLAANMGARLMRQGAANQADVAAHAGGVSATVDMLTSGVVILGLGYIYQHLPEAAAHWLSAIYNNFIGLCSLLIAPLILFTRKERAAAKEYRDAHRP